MNNHLARLEARLERLIESVFAHFFSQSIRAQDIVLHLSRAMTGSVQIGLNGDPRLYAPDRYRISLHPDVQKELLSRAPDLEYILSRHVVALASEAGYRLRTVPTVHLIPDETVPATDIKVKAEHQSLLNGRTAKLDPISPLHNGEAVLRIAQNPQLVINGESTFYLTEDIINVGRSRDNQIILDDPRISRHHAQLRRRAGVYWVFDMSSQSGTFVNDVAVREHALSAGDVIRLGKTQLVYLEDNILDQETSETAPFAG
ncbi:MAG: hypothetical protein CUN53_09445 [Phototrophicales bacterium]|nr:MAG: hypothetical protein CUN53_09445 [Phototrophicales bacterium]